MRLNLMSEATNLKIIKPFRQLDFSFLGNETRLFEFKVKRMHILKKILRCTLSVDNTNKDVKHSKNTCF